MASVSGPWTLETIAPDHLTATYTEDQIRITKTVRISGDRLRPALAVDVSMTNAGPDRIDALFGIEFALMLLGGGHNPAAFHAIAGRRVPHDDTLTVSGIDLLAAGNDQLGIEIETALDGPADAWISPIESVSNSESGFELVYQGSSVVLLRPIGLAAGESASFNVEQRVTITPDPGAVAREAGAVPAEAPAAS